MENTNEETEERLKTYLYIRKTYGILLNREHSWPLNNSGVRGTEPLHS